MSNLKPVERNLRNGPVSRIRALAGRLRSPWPNLSKRDISQPGVWARRLAFLSLMLMPALPSIAADYRDYPDDVRLLLEEYAGASDQGGSLIPSVYAFRSSQTERVLIDFDRGLIVVSAPSISLLLKDIQDVLLTQIDPGVIDTMVSEFRRRDPVPAVVTPVYGLKSETIHNPNVVKTLLAHDGRALYFSRSAIPHVRDVPEAEWHQHTTYWGHVGMYGFRGDVLAAWDQLPASPLEDLERLEQLRLIEAGLTIATFPVQGTSLSVDTAEQLEQARAMV